MQYISVRYVEADTAHHLTSQIRRQVRLYSCNGNHCAGTARRIVRAPGPRLPQVGRRHRQLPPFYLLLLCQCGRRRRHPRTTQDYHTIHPVVFLSRHSIESERLWTPLDLEAGSIVWSIKRLRGYRCSTIFRYFRFTRRSKASTRSQSETHEYNGETTPWNIAKAVQTRTSTISSACLCLRRSSTAVTQQS